MSQYEHTVWMVRKFYSLPLNCLDKKLRLFILRKPSYELDVMAISSIASLDLMLGHTSI